MSLQIEILNDHAVVHPGSQISGIVRLNSKTDESISAVTISFTGRCKVKLRSSEHYTTRSYRSSAIYFLEELALYEGGKFTHKAGNYIWPFSFAVPFEAASHITENASPSRPKRQLDSMGILKLDKNANESPVYDYFTAEPPWRGSKDLRPHPVLDSFSYVHSRWPLDWECRIEYSLCARLKRPPGSFLFMQKDIETRRPVIVRATAPRDLSRLLKQRQTALLSQLVSEKIPSLVAKTQALIRSPPASAGTLALALSTAVSTTPGAGLPILLRRNETLNPENGVDVQLRGFGLTLLINTVVRDNALTALEQKAEKTEIIILSRAKDPEIDIKLPKQTGETIDLGGKFDIRMPIDLVPSFSTYNIHRGYRLGVELKFDYGGQSITITDSSFKIIVLPGYRQAILNVAAPQYEQREQQDSNGDNLLSKETDEQSAEWVSFGHDEKRDEKGNPRPARPNEDDHEQLPAYEP